MSIVKYVKRYLNESKQSKQINEGSDEKTMLLKKLVEDLPEEELFDMIDSIEDYDLKKEIVKYISDKHGYDTDDFGIEPDLEDELDRAEFEEDVEELDYSDDVEEESDSGTLDALKNKYLNNEEDQEESLGRIPGTKTGSRDKGPFGNKKSNKYINNDEDQEESLGRIPSPKTGSRNKGPFGNKKSDKGEYISKMEKKLDEYRKAKGDMEEGIEMYAKVPKTKKMKPKKTNRGFGGRGGATEERSSMDMGSEGGDGGGE